MAEPYQTDRPLRHIYICGTPRSGTTLLMEMMRTCYDWDWAPENEVTLWRACSGRRGRTITKSPRAGLAVRSFLTHPGCWVIYCQRDPRDVVCSRHGLAPDLFWTNLRIWRWIRGVAQSLAGHARFQIVRYEDLVACPDAVQDDLERAMPWLERRALFSAYQTRSRPSDQSLHAIGTLRPTDTNSIGSWRQDLPRLAGQLAQHGDIAAELIEDGYETDAGWMALLETVEPDLTPSYLADHLDLKTRIRLKAKDWATAARLLWHAALSRLRSA